MFHLSAKVRRIKGTAKRNAEIGQQRETWKELGKRNSGNRKSGNQKCEKGTAKIENGKLEM
jgi:hypothetical protein